MMSKETRKLLEEFADKEGVDRKDMENMVNFYYRDIVKIASDWEAPNIDIYGLGILSVKEWMFSEWALGRKQYKKMYAVIKKDRQKEADAIRRKETGELSQKTIFNQYYRLPKEQRVGPPPPKHIKNDTKEHRTDSTGGMEQVPE